MLVQSDINDNMRAILIDWLVEVHYKFRVSPAAPSACRSSWCLCLHTPYIMAKMARVMCSLGCWMCLKRQGWAVQLMPETLFLTTNLIDRFLEKKRVSRRNLQLVRTRLLAV